MEITAPLPGTGIVGVTNILRPQVKLEADIEVNEVSRSAMGSFFQAGLIPTGAASIIPLSGSPNFLGWLKIQRYDASNPGAPWLVENWWVDLHCSEWAEQDNIIAPKWKATWLYSALQGDAC